MENLINIFTKNYLFKLKEERKKSRREFILGNVKICIDKYDEIPAFMEIEATEEEIEETKKILGISEKKSLNYGYDELLKHYGK